jgi:hypothetical protein
MATTSQKMMEMRFLVRIRGALTPPPMIEVPVMKMPLFENQLRARSKLEAARTMLLQPLIILCTNQCPSLPMRKAIHLQGIVQPAYIIRMLPPQCQAIEHTLKASPSPVKSISNRRQFWDHKRPSCILQAPMTVNAVEAPPRT